MLLDAILNPGSFDLADIAVGIFSALAVIFLTMPVHEAAHAWAATKLGDPTPRYQGRLSLNPFNHIDYFGSLCILLFGFGWAKPVQVNPRNFDNPKMGMAITAFAGPLSNLIVAFITAFIFAPLYKFAILEQSHILLYIAMFFFYIAQINVSLAVFNLLPVPPLDGSRLLGIVLPDRIYYKIMQYERYIYYAVLILIFVGAFDLPLSFLSGKIMNMIMFVPEIIFF